MTVRDALYFGVRGLGAAGIPSPEREARLLLAHLLRTDLVGLLRDPGAAVPRGAWAALVARRAARAPLALLIGRRGFWTLDLAVSGDTLIPRADSETLVDSALACLPDARARGRVLDLGTGTGCLLLAVLSERPGLSGVGVDRADGAATLARRNARDAGLDARAVFLVGDWGEAVAGGFDLVLCNPPYIPRATVATLEPEVRDHEPALALDGGVDGLDAYRSILPSLRRLLRPGGHAVLEIGIGQGDAVQALLRDAGLEAVGLRADLAGIPRALTLRNP